MANVTIGDILERARVYERRLEAQYASIRDQSSDDGVRLLTYYLARHRRHLDDALAGYPEADRDRVLGVRLKQDLVFDPLEVLDLAQTPPTRIRGQQLLEAAAAHDGRLVELYKRMLEQPLGQEAAALIRGLVRLEEKDIVMIRKMIAMDYF